MCNPEDTNYTRVVLDRSKKFIYTPFPSKPESKEALVNTPDILTIYNAIVT